MAKYTLKTFLHNKEVERFDHRSSFHLHRILVHPRFDRTFGSYDEQCDKPSKFEIRDSLQMKIFEGNLDDAISYLKTL
jgi:hypothetical protein